jgi:succinate--hydroxymethylglutarate CoA-transferase
LLKRCPWSRLEGSWLPPSAETIASAPQEASHLPPESAYFLSANRNKRSIGINLKHPKGLEVVRQLIESADILAENFVPGKLDELGLGYEDCRRINPRLIYASITGMSGVF